MKLNLREIIEIPGGSVPFAQELDTALLDFPSVRAYTAPITAEGKVVNTAGILTLQGKLHAEMLCVCDLNASAARDTALRHDIPRCTLMWRLCWRKSIPIWYPSAHPIPRTRDWLRRR